MRLPAFTLVVLSLATACATSRQRTHVDAGARDTGAVTTDTGSTIDAYVPGVDAYVPGVDAFQIVEIGNLNGGDVFFAVPRRVFGQIEEELEHVLGPVKEMCVPVLPDDGGNPVRVVGNDHAAYRAQILLARPGRGRFLG